VNPIQQLGERLGARVLVAMANRSPQVLAVGQARIERGEYPDMVDATIEGEVMVFRWAGHVILTLPRGSLAPDEYDS